MAKLLVESWVLLLYFDIALYLSGLRRICDKVRGQSLHAVDETEAISSDQLCHAVDLASVFYFKRVLCLQRSVATSILLRRHGWKAEMVIGAQLYPFRSHAWVELAGTVVNDKPYMPELYQELERC